MKDYVFIGWSRNRDLAIEIKRILDTQGFVCVVGGIYEDNPESVRTRRGTVNETVNFQMNHCDQSILLFQKIDDTQKISGNLIYELGYINAQYNFIETSTKLHIFKLDITGADDNIFPSDLHGIWGTNISTSGKSISDIAKEICDGFLNNQNQIQRRDLFSVLNDHYFVEYEMRKHFTNPTMSDYDLALLILVYVQAGYCYQEQIDIKQKIEQFRAKMVENSIRSVELDWVINYAIQTLTLFCLTIPDEEHGQLNMPGSTFRGLLNRYTEIGESIGERFEAEFNTTELYDIRIFEDFIERNAFEAWLIAQMQEHVTYLILVYLLNHELGEEEKTRYAKLGVKYCLATIENLEVLTGKEEGKRFAWLLLGYAYKNLSTFYSYLGESENVLKYHKKSFKTRKNLYSYAEGMPTIKPSLKDYISLEYLFQVIEEVKSCEDKYEREDYMLEIKAFIEKRQKTERNRNYVFNSLVEDYNKLS